jgi:hypothetical protein
MSLRRAIEFGPGDDAELLLLITSLVLAAESGALTYDAAARASGFSPDALREMRDRAVAKAREFCTRVEQARRVRRARDN